jgi:hypothetical protein
MEIPMFISSEVAKRCDCSTITAVKWAQKNKVNFVGTGRRKIFVWFQDDVERFKLREKPGRRWK